MTNGQITWSGTINIKVGVCSNSHFSHFSKDPSISRGHWDESPIFHCVWIMMGIAFQWSGCFFGKTCTSSSIFTTPSCMEVESMISPHLWVIRSPPTMCSCFEGKVAETSFYLFSKTESKWNWTKTMFCKTPARQHSTEKILVTTIQKRHFFFLQDLSESSRGGLAHCDF